MLREISQSQMINIVCMKYPDLSIRQSGACWMQGIRGEEDGKTLNK